MSPKDMFPAMMTERLALVPLGEEHLHFVRDHFSAPEVCKFLYDAEPVASVEDAQEIVSFFRQSEKSSCCRWVLTLPESHMSIGTCGFHCWDRANQTIELGYDLAPSHQKKGYMREALLAILRFGFESLELNRVQAFVALQNEPSTRVLEKLGFVREGIWRDKHLFRGQYYDHFMYSLLRNDVHF